MSASSSTFPTFAAASKHPERLNLLFSPFRAKALNPEHYEEKLKFWSRVIEEYVVKEKKISFSIKDIQTNFRTTDGKRPACLIDVINHLLRENVIVPREDWVNSFRYNDTWVSWSINSVKWVFTKMLSYAPVNVTYTKRDFDPESQFIHLVQLQNQEENLMNTMSLQNKLVGFGELKTEMETQIPAPEDMDAVIEHLKSERKLLTDHISHFQVVKLANPNLSTKLEITSAEKSLYDITHTIEHIEAQVAGLLEKQEQADMLARQSLKEGKRSTAKHHLRTKKLAEKRAAKLNEVLDNLASISTQIEDSASDALVVAAYEAGKKALAKQLKDNNLNTNRVTETMLDLQEVLEDYNEVSTSISTPITTDEAMDVDMDEELAMLLKEDKTKATTPTIRIRDETEEALRQLDEMSTAGLEPLPIRKPGRNLVRDAT